MTPYLFLIALGTAMLAGGLRLLRVYQRRDVIQRRLFAVS